LNAPQIPTKSTFVTVIAWIFIVLSGFSTLIGILQNIMVQIMFSAPDMQAAMEASNQTESMPAAAQFMFNNIRWLFLLVLLVSLTMLTSSVGLLKRKNWARVLFITMMALGILWNMASFIFQFVMFSTMSNMPSNTPPDFQAQFNAFSMAIAVFSGLIVLAISILFGWIIKRLISPEIKQEFHAGP
jgi:hypothetical protein